MIRQNPKIVVVVGPTASGKSDLAVLLARKFNGEVISADSRQVYIGLDIGTGKITADEMSGVPHHMLSVFPADSVYTVSEYCAHAKASMDDVLKRGKLPVVCGGTGFYIRALVDGLILPDVPPDPKLRESLLPFNAEALYEKLVSLDHDFASIVDKHNPHRLIRAIEIATALGSVPPITMQSSYDPCFIGIATDLYTLRERIHTRLLSRLEAGMVDEARSLHEAGLSYERMESLGLEYRHLARLLEGKLSLDEMTVQLENEIFQYAKRQLTWFKRDNRIHWFEKEDLPSVEKALRQHLLNS